MANNNSNNQADVYVFIQPTLEALKFWIYTDKQDVLDMLKQSYETIYYDPTSGHIQIRCFTTDIATEVNTFKQKINDLNSDYKIEWCMDLGCKK